MLGDDYSSDLQPRGKNRNGPFIFSLRTYGRLKHSCWLEPVSSGRVELRRKDASHGVLRDGIKEVRISYAGA